MRGSLRPMGFGDLLDSVEHRPWPAPERPWVMTMRWLDLLFAHWPISPATIQKRLPNGLSLDTFDGQAWVGVVPFRMEKVAPRGMTLGPFSAFPELNVRTYVTRDGKPGVWFFSLDAQSHSAVWGARGMFHLPYFYAEMGCEAQPSGAVNYHSRRRHPDTHEGRFVGRYRALGEPYLAEAGSFEHWLTERYCLYAEHGGVIYRGDIHHLPWPLQRAELELEANTVTDMHGFALRGRPAALHFVPKLDVIGWWLERCD